MTQEIINIGASANDGLGDPLRLAFEKINNNFTQLYSFSAIGSSPPDTAVQFRATNSLNCVGYSNGTWVSFGNPARYYVSLDGVNWTSRTSPTNQAIYCVQTTPTGFIAVGNYGTVITSNNAGVTWTTRYSGTLEDLRSVYYDRISTLYCACGHNGTIITSVDGISWTVQTSGSANDLYGIVYSSLSTGYVAVGSTGTLLTSFNGTSWTTRVSGVATALNSVIFNGTAYVVVGDAGVILYSLNSIAWLPRVSGTSAVLNGITVATIANVSTTVTVGANGTALTSVDGGGVTWTSYPTGTSSTLNDVNFGNTYFYAVGLDGTVLKSNTATSWTNINIVGTFSGSESFTFNDTSNTLSVTNIAVTNSVANVSVANVMVANQVVVYERTDLGSVANVVITGGVNGYVLATDGTGNLSWTLQAGGGGGNGFPGGTNSQVQFNNAGAFDGTAGFTFNSIANSISVTGNAVVGGILTNNYYYSNGAPFGDQFYSNSNVANFLPTYTGNLNSLTSTRSNTFTLGNNITLVSTTEWNIVPVSSSAIVSIMVIPSAGVTHIDFNVTATDTTTNASRQISKLMVINYDGVVNYSEYGTLVVGSLIGEFTATLQGGAILLQVTPNTTNIISYGVVAVIYY